MFAGQIRAGIVDTGWVPETQEQINSCRKHKTLVLISIFLARGARSMCISSGLSWSMCSFSGIRSIILVVCVELLVSVVCVVPIVVVQWFM